MGTPIVVYFNHWFSSMAQIIKDLKLKYNTDLYIIGSSTNKYATYRDLVDTFIYEDDMKGKGLNSHIDIMYNICNEYDVQLFFCRDKLKEFNASQIERFRAIGTKVILDKCDTIDDKIALYEELGTDCTWGFVDVAIPEYYNPRNKDKEQVINDIQNMFKSDKQYILKKSIDEGGISFRKIVDTVEYNYNSLSGYGSNIITKEQVLQILESSTKAEIDNLLIMERLGTPEYSVDCYNSPRGFVAVSRVKNGRVQDLEKLVDNDPLKEYCLKIANRFNIKYPFNIQFMADATTREIKLLEINLRLSGGAYLLLSLGKLNLIEQCLIDNSDITPSKDTRNIEVAKVAYVEDYIEI